MYSKDVDVAKVAEDPSAFILRFASAEEVRLRSCTRILEPSMVPKSVAVPSSMRLPALGSKTRMASMHGTRAFTRNAAQHCQALTAYACVHK